MNKIMQRVNIVINILWIIIAGIGLINLFSGSITLIKMMKTGIHEWNHQEKLKEAIKKIITGVILLIIAITIFRVWDRIYSIL